MENTKARDELIELIIKDSAYFRKLYARYNSVYVAVTDVSQLFIHFRVSTSSRSYQHYPVNVIPMVNSFRNCFRDLLPMKYFRAEFVYDPTYVWGQDLKVTQGRFYERDITVHEPCPTIMIEEVLGSWRDEARETYQKLFERLGV